MKNTKASQKEEAEAPNADSKEKKQAFYRDEKGLISSVDHIYSENGMVNWRGMIKKEHLVPNKDAIKNQKDIDISTLSDSQLLILLAGIKELAQLRGYENVKYKVIQASPNYVAVKCTIDWIPNYETDMRKVSFSALADAHLENTKSFAKDFLMAIAENRAFVRAVRNFLRINIVGTDEIGDTSKGQISPDVADVNSAVSSTHPVNVLTDLMKKTKIPFETIRQTLEKEGVKEASTWVDTSSIPSKIIFQLIQRLKKKAQPDDSFN